MPDSNARHPASLSVVELLKDCRITKTRASGPGGQHRNKVETAIVIEHSPSKIIGQASEKRSQAANREVAIGRLRVNLAVGIRTNRQRTSKLWQRRSNQGKLSVNRRHVDYPSVLAEALDFVWQYELDVSEAAKALAISTSQLTKFIKTCPSSFEQLNRARRDAGLHPLK